MLCKDARCVKGIKIYARIKLQGIINLSFNKMAGCTDFLINPRYDGSLVTVLHKIFALIEYIFDRLLIYSNCGC